jgi:hypothetical protein
MIYFLRAERDDGSYTEEHALGNADMTKPPKSITTRSVHAALRRIGFGAWKKGRSPGYTVRDAGPSVRVSWAGTDDTTPREQVVENVKEIGNALVGAGFVCRLDGCQIVIRKGSDRP